MSDQHTERKGCIITRQTIANALSYLRNPVPGVRSGHSLQKCWETLTTEDPDKHSDIWLDTFSQETVIRLSATDRARVTQAVLSVDSSPTWGPTGQRCAYHNSRHTGFVLAHACRMVLNQTAQTVENLWREHLMESLIFAAILHDYCYGNYQALGFDTSPNGVWADEQAAFVQGCHLIPEHLRKSVYALILITNVGVRNLYRSHDLHPGCYYSDPDYQNESVRFMFSQVQKVFKTSAPDGCYRRAMDIGLRIISDADLCESFYVGRQAFKEQTGLVEKEVGHPIEPRAQLNFMNYIGAPLCSGTTGPEKEAFEGIRQHLESKS